MMLSLCTGYAAPLPEKLRVEVSDPTAPASAEPAEAPDFLNDPLAA